tara:strand:- start:44 stop:244 length:201 start_codon:yes stop_codon:yes gene_type:complete
MTKKELIDLIAEYPDDASVVIEVHDTSLHEDLYDFTLDCVSWTRFEPGRQTEMHELRLTAINHNEK